MWETFLVGHCNVLIEVPTVPTLAAHPKRLIFHAKGTKGHFVPAGTQSPKFWKRHPTWRQERENYDDLAGTCLFPC